MFAKLTMKVRLMLVVVPLILVLATLGLLGLTGLKSSNQALFNVYEDGMVDFSHIAMIDQLMARARGDASRPLFDEEDESFAESAGKLTQKIAAIREEHAKFLATGLTGDEKALSEEFATHLEAYLKDGLEPAIEALLEKNRMALRLIYTDKVEPLYSK
ncbi:MAG: Tar ligand binding domain-containing protein, partial [Nevskiaceae bacterium]